MISAAFAPTPDRAEVISRSEYGRSVVDDDHIRTRRIARQAPARILIFAFVAAVIVFAARGILFAKVSAQQPASGTLKGQIGATKNTGEVVPPESAVIYIFFSAAMRNGTFSHAADTETAGGQFTFQLNRSLSKNSALKRLQKRAGNNPYPETADQIAEYSLQAVDDALTQTREWLAKHPDRAWQMKTLAPNEQGVWIAEALPPGGYEVVVRGKFAGHDADWEAAADLAAGNTVSLLLTQPRFFRRE
jgi:hypothetical protein